MAIELYTKGDSPATQFVVASLVGTEKIIDKLARGAINTLSTPNSQYILYDQLSAKEVLATEATIYDRLLRILQNGPHWEIAKHIIDKRVLETPLPPGFTRDTMTAKMQITALHKEVYRNNKLWDWDHFWNQDLALYESDTEAQFYIRALFKANTPYRTTSFNTYIPLKLKLIKGGFRLEADMLSDLKKWVAEHRKQANKIAQNGIMECYDLNVFPRDLTGFPNVTNISAFKAGFRSLPASIGSMKHLTTLYLYGTPLKYVDPAFAKLEKLQYLGVDLKVLHTFAQTLPKLSNLKKLTLDQESKYNGATKLLFKALSITVTPTRSNWECDTSDPSSIEAWCKERHSIGGMRFSLEGEPLQDMLNALSLYYRAELVYKAVFAIHNRSQARKLY